LRYKQSANGKSNYPFHQTRLKALRSIADYPQLAFADVLQYAIFQLNRFFPPKTMAIEVEHKFLLANEDWRQEIDHSEIFRQGYLSSQPTSSIRVRICEQKAWLNIKSATIGTHRLEYEYEIPVSDAQEILTHLCNKPLIEKVRHYVRRGNDLWEIDEFEGANRGLIVAEIELDEIGRHFDKPTWVGVEVTHDLRYYNNNLAIHPFSEWGNTG
jgi:adenylate cyclase